MEARKEDSVSAGGRPLPAFLAHVPRPLLKRPPATAPAPTKADSTTTNLDAKEVPPPALQLDQIPRPLFKSAQQQKVPGATSAPPSAEPADAQKVPDSTSAPPRDEPVDAVADAQTSLPAVISVKKSRKGCAVVLLRDPAIIDRCVLQRAAVIDGVCVEMTRHVKKSRIQDEESSDEPAGVFVAWGARVEQKVPVSEEGIEEFFNSLAGKPCPKGLVATPPFTEGHVSFSLSSDGMVPLTEQVCPIKASREDILSSAYCRQHLIRGLWEAKDRLDSLWERPPPPMARSLMMRVARAQLFPCSGEGGRDHENRAGDKLAELSGFTDLLKDVPAGSAFLDLCGGPGAWSQHLLGNKDLNLRGFGFTLKAGSGEAEDWKAQAKDEWYEDLYQHRNWTALWGADGTGDLLKPGNLEHCVRQLAREEVLLCVADGGFSDEAIPQNLQELYFYRLFLAELLTAVSCLKPGGKFICKLYTAFSASTAALLYLTTRAFDKVDIVKPMTSKATGPERYLVAVGFRDSADTSAIQAALARSHASGAGASPLVTPLLTPIVATESLAEDDEFSSSMGSMVTELCIRQTKALNAVVDRADFLEDMAMECAVCTNPWIKRAPRPSETKEKKYDEPRRFRDVPTPSRGGMSRFRGSHRNWGPDGGYQ